MGLFVGGVNHRLMSERGKGSREKKGFTKTYDKMFLVACPYVRNLFRGSCERGPRLE